jgi:tetratricopeptide (TPR) repeat protein
MADEAEEAGPSADTNSLAVDLAMAEARRDPGLQGHVAAFLDDQRGLIADQRHHLHLGVWEKRLGVALRLATLAVGLAFAAGLGLMVWDAAHSEGLLIEPFTVPADLAARGLGGPAFSNLLLDKLTLLQEQTQSNRPAQSYANNWGDDLKVEIPETGVSLGEIHRYLREWLGHDTHISGEVWQSAGGLAIVARASGAKGEIVTGPESDLDALMQKVAENVYRVTQPYRYANYLDRDDFHPGRTDYVTAEQIYRRLVTDPDPVERGYAWNGLANLAWTLKGDDEAALGFYQKAIEVNPAYSGANFGIAFIGIMHLSRPEAALDAARKYARQATGYNKNQWLDAVTGDYGDSLAVAERGLEQPDPGLQARSQAMGILALAQMHDANGLRDWLRELPPEFRSTTGMPRSWMRLLADAALEDWHRVLVTEPEAEKQFLATSPGWDSKGLFSRSMRPQLALAKAKLGDHAGAQTLIASSPADCYDCLRIRGQIAAEASQWGRADYWFDRAVHDAPSIPFAWHDWGRMLLARGDAGGAIEKFRLANARGPHFADPLEGWGEAMMAKSRSHLALAKFAEAQKYAPNWGRLHLKWGEALAYAGKKDEAKAQFARAAALDLAPDEKAELAKHS